MCWVRRREKKTSRGAFSTRRAGPLVMVRVPIGPQLSPCQLRHCDTEQEAVGAGVVRAPVEGAADERRFRQAVLGALRQAGDAAKRPGVT